MSVDLNASSKRTTVRLAVDSDVSAITEIVSRIVPIMNAQGNFQWTADYPTAEHFTRDIVSGNLYVAVVISSSPSLASSVCYALPGDEGRVVGAIALETSQPEDYLMTDKWLSEGRCVVPHRLVVDPEEQGNGIGTVLMGQAEVLAATLGINAIRVDTNKENKVTNKMFPKLGYRYVAEIELAFRPGLQFTCYEKILNKS